MGCANFAPGGWWGGSGGGGVLHAAPSAVQGLPTGGDGGHGGGRHWPPQAAAASEACVHACCALPRCACAGQDARHGAGQGGGPEAELDGHQRLMRAGAARPQFSVCDLCCMQLPAAERGLRFCEVIHGFGACVLREMHVCGQPLAARLVRGCKISIALQTL